MGPISGNQVVLILGNRVGPIRGNFAEESPEREHADGDYWIWMLVRAVNESRAQSGQAFDSQFALLKEHDPQLAAALFDVFGSATGAMEWFTRPSKFFDQQLPLSLIEIGKRQEVLDELARIEYGVY